jgi:phosphoserine phosphatase
MNLIVQGLDVATPDLKQLAKMSGASSIEALTPTAFKLPGAAPAAAVESYSDQARLDYAFVPDDRRLADFKLCVMDMDSTLITIECIDEIADMVGVKPQVAAITAAAMRGELDYPQSLRQRVSLLKGLDAQALQRVYEERLKLSPGAQIMLDGFRKAGLKTLLVSGGFTFFTERLQRRLDIDYTRSNVLDIVDGKLSGDVIGDIVDANVKRDALVKCRDELGLRKEQLIAIGDGANDLKFLAEGHVSIAYHAKPVVRAQATHAINYVGLDGVLNLFN